MMIYDAIVRRRTIRRFKEREVALDSLKKLVDAGRLAASGGNVQPIEYVVVIDKMIREQIFPHLRWAAYIRPRGNPRPGEEPTAYVVMLVNKALRERGYEYDVGCAAENICLAAVGEGLGTCMMRAIDREEIGQILKVPRPYEVDLVISIGYPKEEPVVEQAVDSIKYWKDEGGVLHVPKRKLEDILHVDGF